MFTTVFENFGALEFWQIIKKVKRILKKTFKKKIKKCYTENANPLGDGIEWEF